MSKYRTIKPQTHMVKETDRTEARGGDYVSDLLKRAPHLELLRSAARSDEGQDSRPRDELLEDFRRMVTNEDDRVEPVPKRTRRR